jgi:dihydrodipicolinate synthase/N-acetylneuraminate lyase
VANEPFEGVFAATVTPFIPDGSAIDEGAICRLADRLIGAGVAGLVPCGSTGEFPHLSLSERQRVVEVSVAAAGGRVPVIAHTGALSTAHTVELSVHAARAGAAAVMVIPPFYDPLSWAELVAHYRAVADAVEVPIVLYNIPSVTRLELTPAQIVELAGAAGIRYIKDTSGNASALTELMQRYRTQITVLNGWDSMSLIGFLAGVRATIWGAVNVMPALCVELWRRAVLDQDLVGARAVWDRIWPVISFFETHPYTTSIKAGCDLIGESAGPARRPFLPLNADEIGELRALLDAAGVPMPAAVS